MGLSENGPYGHLNVEKMMINHQNWGYPTPSVHHSVEEGLVQLLLTVHNGMGQVTKRTGGHKVVLNPESRHQEERMSSYCPSLLISSPFICCNLVYKENTRLSPTITNHHQPMTVAQVGPSVSFSLYVAKLSPFVGTPCSFARMHPRHSPQAP